MHGERENIVGRYQTLACVSPVAVLVYMYDYDQLLKCQVQPSIHGSRP